MKPSATSFMLLQTSAFAALSSLSLQAFADTTATAPLESIVITASRHETALTEAPASVSIVTQEELKLSNADDLADALSGEVGVNISSVGLTRQGISMRGMPVEHTLYLIDGRRVNSSNSVIAHSDYELGWLPHAAIERIEVVRGPMSSLYGADALGGVINIITTPPSDEFYGEVSTDTSWLDDQDGGTTQKQSFYLSGPIIDNQLSFSLAGQLFNRDNLPSEENAQQSLIEERESKSLYSSLKWALTEQQTLNFSYSFSDDERNNDIVSTSTNYRSTDDIDREQISLSYSGEWENSHIQINAYQAKLEVENNRTNGSTPSRPRTITDQVVDGHWGSQISPDHLLTIGGQLRKENLEDSQVSAGGEVSAIHQGLFIQDEWQMSDPFTLTAGLGVDKHEDYGSEINPRIYGVYQWSPEWIIKGGYGEGFRAPSLTELSDEYEVLAAGGRLWVDGNENLEPERSKSYELGVDYQQTTWSASARIFENQLEDLVQSVCYTNCGIRGSERRRYENLAESTILGAELSWQAEITPSFSASVNYTYLDTEDKETGEPLEDRPQFMARVKLNWQPMPAVLVRWRSEFNGKQYAGGDDYTPHYNLHHLDLAYDLNEHFTVYAGVENLFDERLAEKSDLFSWDEPGRELRVGLTARF